MSEMTLDALSNHMGRIDFAMLSTRTEGGALASRPMSNNGQVAYRGDSFFFTYDGARTVSDIEADAQVGLTFTGAAGLLSGPPLFIAVEGRAALIRDKAAFAAHWTDGLDRWFEQGIDTPGLVLIQVHADRIHYWNGSDEGEVAL